MYVRIYHGIVYHTQCLSLFMDTTIILDTEKQSLEAELVELEKKRDAYATKITRMAVQIAVIFVIPLILGIGVHFWFNISYPATMPFAFVLSWLGVSYLYRKIDREVRTLEKRIHEIKQTLDTTLRS